MRAPFGALCDYSSNHDTMTQKGTINELTERSSGFIKRTGVKEHLFFHADALKGVDFKELHTGDKVTFTVTESRKGPYATEVSRA